MCMCVVERDAEYLKCRALILIRDVGIKLCELMYLPIVYL